MAKIPQCYLDIDPWIIRETGFHPERGLVSELIFALGNEFMGVRGYFEEGYSGEGMIGSYFNGIFEDKPIIQPVHFKGMSKRSHFLLNSVDWLHTRIRVGRETLDLAKSKFSAFERTLDLRTGVLVRYWGHAARLDLDDYNRNTYEGLHTTSMAAAWMNVVYGFGGMRTDGPRLDFAPSIPKRWKGFIFRVIHHGAVLGVRVNKREIVFRLVEGPAFAIGVYGRKRQVTHTGFSVPLPADRVG